MIERKKTRPRSWVRGIRTEVRKKKGQRPQVAARGVAAADFFPFLTTSFLSFF
jgi:hypothetical protein